MISMIIFFVQFNSFDAKCMYTCFLTQPYNHLCDSCQCCVYYKEWLLIPCCTFTYMQFSDMNVTSHVDAEVKPRWGTGGVSTSCVSIIISHVWLQQTILMMNWKKAVEME